MIRRITISALDESLNTRRQPVVRCLLHELVAVRGRDFDNLALQWDLVKQNGATLCSDVYDHRLLGFTITLISSDARLPRIRVHTLDQSVYALAYFQHVNSRNFNILSSNFTNTPDAICNIPGSIITGIASPASALGKPKCWPREAAHMPIVKHAEAR